MCPIQFFLYINKRIELKHGGFGKTVSSQSYKILVKWLLAQLSAILLGFMHKRILIT